MKVLKMKRVNKNVVSILLAICVLFVSSIFAFADNDTDNILPNEDRQPIITSTVDTEVLRISPSDTSGFHAVVLGLIGDYNSIVKDYTYITTGYNGQQTTNHVVEITPDWSWIMTCALFIIIVYCFFRFIGSLVSGGKI